MGAVADVIRDLALPGQLGGGAPALRAIVERVPIRRSGWLRACATSLVMLSGCGPSAPPASASQAGYVLRLDALAEGSFGGRGHAQWARDAVADGLDGAQWFRARGEGEPLDATLRFEERRSEQDFPLLRVNLEIEPDDRLATELAAIGLELAAHVELERRDHTIELRRDLPVAVERAIALVDAKVTLARGAPSAVVALLADDDPEVVLVALHGVERRRLTSLGDAVVLLLDHGDERVGLRAVECLGVVGGPEHAPGLLRTARLADRAHANRLYEALANLGGIHARGFLEFAARNEEDPELASQAERALARLQSAKPSPVASADAVARGHRQ